ARAAREQVLDLLRAVGDLARALLELGLDGLVQFGPALLRLRPEARLELGPARLELGLALLIARDEVGLLELERLDELLLARLFLALVGLRHRGEVRAQARERLLRAQPVRVDPRALLGAHLHARLDLPALHHLLALGGLLLPLLRLLLPLREARVHLGETRFE